MLLGSSGSWVGVAASILNLGRFWFYQDFSSHPGTSLTLTGNSNGTGGLAWNSANIVTNSAVATDTNGNPINSALPAVPANEVSATNSGSAVTLTGNPDASFGTVRIWYLYTVSASNAPTNLTVAPLFVTTSMSQWLDAYFLNQNLNLSDLTSATTALTNLGFSTQTAGQVLYGNGAATFASGANLFWDTGNNRLGIGTNSPSQQFHIFKSSGQAEALIEAQVTSTQPNLTLQAARNANANLATNDVVGDLIFNARYNATTGAVAKISGNYTGSGTTQLGSLTFYTSNAGAPALALTIAASGNAVFVGTVTASNLSGTNSGDVTLAAVGSSPNANGASLSGQVLNLQAADGTNPGALTAGTQTIGGTKSFSSYINLPAGTGTNPSVSIPTGGGNFGMYMSGNGGTLVYNTSDVAAFSATTWAAYVPISLFLITAASAPGLYFISDATTGWFRPSVNQWGWSASGVQKINLSSSGLGINGSSSGAVTIAATASPTSYTIVLPGAQGGANTAPVNDGSGNLSWTAIALATTYKSDTFSMANATRSFSVTFGTDFGSANYSVSLSFQSADLNPEYFSHVIVSKTSAGFSFELNENTPTANYTCQWMVLGKNNS